MRATGPPEKNRFASTLKATLGFGGDRRGRLRRYGHYLFVVSVLTMLVCVLALLNARFRFINVSSYDISKEGLSSPFMLAGYLGMFISIWISPVPDYIIVPGYGFLASIGLFNPYTTFLVCLAAALVPVEYACGRLVPRPLLLKSVSYVHITEESIEEADRWLVEHGRFSIFISTFIPFFYSVSSLAAGTLKMNAARFFLASAVGFALRFVFLEYAGYYSIYIFTPSFDYSQMPLLSLLLILSSVYAALYLVRTVQPTGRVVPAS